MSLADALHRGLVGLQAQGLAVSTDAEAKLLEYVALIAKWNRTYNLTAVREPERMITHHVLDSLAILPALHPPTGASVLDIGSGAGLPGIPIALARPDLRVTLLDSNSKKAAFLEQCRIELGLPNVVVACRRVEDLADAGVFDVIVSRAFAELVDLLKVARPLLARSGVVAAMKGVIPHEELAALPADVSAAPIPIDVPGLNANRCLVRLQLAQ